MPDPAWPSSPPEVNYLRLVGPGAGGTATTLASGVAWQALMGSNELAFSLSSLNTTVTALNFEGAGGTGSTAAVTGLNTALQLLCGWVQEKPPIATSAVAAYETAVSTMIPAEVSLANRAEQAADVALNPLVLGALTPAIVALDAAYFGEYWPHNASAGAAYGSALTALAAALAVPPPLAPPGASAAGPATAAAAVAQTAGQAAAGEAMKQSAQLTDATGDAGSAPAAAAGQMTSMLAQPMQAAVGAMQPVMGMFGAPLQSVQGLSSLPQSMLGALGSGIGPVDARDASIPAALLSGAAGLGAGGAGVGPGAGPVAGIGSAGAGGGVGGLPGAGLTSYTRPASSFAPENSGQPTGLKTGLLSAADLRGPTTTGGGAVPISPTQAGMLGGGRGEGKGSEGKDTVSHARIIAGGQPRSADRIS